jgi:16S rRNA (guanine966-N2)-methyltransferase
MRIIGGSRGGTIIKAPKNLPVRPITDRSKESLFNILENRYDLDEVSVLDLFSGTGNISYEFASRGSESITAVDMNYHCCKFIVRQSEKLGFKQIKVVKQSAEAFLKSKAAQWDLIFADPPYAFSHGQYLELIRLIFEVDALKINGSFILEHHSVNNFEDHPNFVEKRVYGQNILSFFELADQD